MTVFQCLGHLRHVELLGKERNRKFLFLEPLLDSTTNGYETKGKLRAKEKGACFGVFICLFVCCLLE